MEISRRKFIGCAGAFPIVGTAAFADGEPLLRIGVMTDTHVGETKASCRRVKMACELFRKHCVDMVVNVGDLADYHYPKGYAAYRAVVEAAFAGIPAARRCRRKAASSRWGAAMRGLSSRRAFGTGQRAPGSAFQ